MSVHSKFILTPIETILDEASNITRGIGGGIEIYPVWEYILQSILLKMTGAQEQKMKCICWEIASVDYDIRRDIYIKWDLGECSTFKHKRKILKYLLEALKKIKNDFNVESTIDLNKIFFDTKDILKKFYEESGTSGFMKKTYEEYIEIYNSIGPDCLSKELIFNNCENCRHKNDLTKPYTCAQKKNLVYMCDSLYHFRNRIAHNLLSYQHNKPNFDTFIDNDVIYENYFIRFSLLIIIDKLFISLFKSFKDELDLSKLF